MKDVHVTGAVTGDYSLAEQLPDGSLLLMPNSGPLNYTGRPATPEEFEAFVRENDVLPPDSEG